MTVEPFGGRASIAGPIRPAGAAEDDPGPRCLLTAGSRTGHTEPMTASTTVTGPGRSGPEIRAALAEHAPAELAAFERDFHSALSDAAASFDTHPLEQVLTHW